MNVSESDSVGYLHGLPSFGLFTCAMNRYGDCARRDREFVWL
jgi:hypothetical protein